MLGVNEPLQWSHMTGLSVNVYYYISVCGDNVLGYIRCRQRVNLPCPAGQGHTHLAQPCHGKYMCSLFGVNKQTKYSNWPSD